MRNIFLFTRREYLQAVRKKSFLIFTMITPLMMFAFTVLPSKLMMSKQGGLHRIVIASENTEFAAQVKARLNDKDRERTRDFDVTLVSSVSPETQSDLEKKIDARQLDSFVWAPQADIEQNKAQFFSRNSSDLNTTGTVEGALNYAAGRMRMGKRGITPAEADTLLKRIEMETQRVQNGKAEKSSNLGAFFTAIGMMILLYMTLIIYGMSVLRSILEEKNSRIFEVLLSAATPKQLMAGKILGTGLVGLTQIAIWAFFALFGIGGAAATMTMGGQPVKLNFSVTIFLEFAVFFILGYLLYSTLCAALGAMVNSEQEAQQLQFFVLMPLILCMVFMTPVITAPDSTLAVVMSLIPFCTPLLMFVRIIVDPSTPIWQIGLSIGLMLVTIYGMLSLCSRIYRVGILMYGKRPTLPEILKWLKYA